MEPEFDDDVAATSELLPKRRRIDRDLDEDAKLAPARQAHLNLGYDGIYPLDAPGMPLPGPDFMEQARREGDLTAVAKVKIAGSDGKKGKTVEQLVTAGDVLTELHRRALRDPDFKMPIKIKEGVRKVVPFVPGHIWGQHMQEYMNGDRVPVDGPRPANVMVIGKQPGKTEVQEGRCFVGEVGRLLVQTCRDMKVKDTSKWYVTSLIKFQPPEGQNTIKKAWEKDCLPLLHQELRLVRPRYILCLGSDASKALLGPKFSVGHMDGRVVEFEFPVNTGPVDDPAAELTHKCLVMTVVNPGAVSRDPTQQRALERGLARFNLLQQGIRWDKEELDVDHRTIRNIDELRDLLAEIDNDPDADPCKWTAVDAEWHGEHPVNAGSYVRTIQFSWKEKAAAAIVLTHAGGAWAFSDDEEGMEYHEAKHLPGCRRMVAMLNKWFRGRRVIGHFLVADLEWLVDLGLTQVKDSFRVPLYDANFDDLDPKLQLAYTKHGFKPGDTIPAWYRTKEEGGWDTGLAGRDIEETAMLGLEALTIRYTTCPRYDLPLQEWKEKWCKEHGKKAKDMEGYGECPDEVLVPYGNYDADGTRRLAFEQMPLIDCDYEGNNCRETFWESMITTMPILEIHQEGILVDKRRIDAFTVTFMTAKAQQEEKIRKWARWPDFNIRSVMQVREFLFGEELNGKVTKDGQTIRLRPRKGDKLGKGDDGKDILATEDARSLYLDPILDTSKPPKPWWEIVEKGLTKERTAGTGKTILGALAQDNPEEMEQIQWLRDHRFLDQVLKSLLRPPRTDKQGNVLYEEWDDAGGDTGIDPSTGQAATAARSTQADNLGSMIFDAGLASVMCDDGKVRTHLYPTTETKRWRSARPNLQNISKRRDDDYLRILGKERYRHKLRSVLMAEPGMALIEADFKSAELYCMAIMSGDPVLLDHCTRNQLPEDHPDYYDIHSNVAVQAFGLHCEPTKSGLKSIGKVSLRVAAKNVIFGVAYGRGAKAIALQCKEEGNPISVDDAERIIEAVFEMYRGLVPFFEEAKRRSRDERWLCSCFGAFRRFPATDDRMMAGEFERQAMNFGIQSMVASAMDRAIAYLQDYRDTVIGDPNFFRIKLQIHDAILVACPYENVEEVADVILPHCMTERVTIWPSTLDGMPTGAGPYHLGTDVEVFHHWGEKFQPDECERLGIPLKFAGKAA